MKKEFSVVDVEVFARKVELLCDHIIRGAEYTDDRNAVQRLREEAADLQTADIRGSLLKGLSEILS